MRPLGMRLVPQQTSQTGQLRRLSSCGPCGHTRTLPGPISIHWPSLEGSAAWGGQQGCGIACACVCACAHLRSPPCLLRVAQTRRRGGTWSPSALTRGCSRMCVRSGLTHSVSHGGDPAVLMRTGVQHTEAGVHATGRQPLPYSETTLQEVTRSSGRSAKAVGSGRRRRQTWMKGSVGCPARPDA